ncbi:MAG: hypothetical protein ACOYMO_00865 [Phycisphaerales bacterium]
MHLLQVAACSKYSLQLGEAVTEFVFATISLQSADVILIATAQDGRMQVPFFKAFTCVHRIKNHAHRTRSAHVLHISFTQGSTNLKQGGADSPA